MPWWEAIIFVLFSVVTISIAAAFIDGISYMFADSISKTKEPSGVLRIIMALMLLGIMGALVIFWDVSVKIFGIIKDEQKIFNK